MLASRDEWSAAFAAADRGGAVTGALLRWRQLRESDDGDFLSYAAFLADHADWPGLDRLRANGETAIPEGAVPGAVLAFFGNEAPQTGQGARALAAALVAQGRTAEAEAMVTEAWLTLTLTDAGQGALLGAYPALLAPLHQARAEAMLWRGRASDAERMLPLLADGPRALARARIALIRGNGNATSLIADVPAALRTDPGLAHDRFADLVADGDFTQAMGIVEGRSDAASLGEPQRWATGRAQIARWLMREGRAPEAYAIASRHALSEGDGYADLEWLAGYLALRYQGDAPTALAHFRRSEAAVTGPISVSRAAYWTGRAEEALGLPDDAAISFARAARFQTAFYGLLAAEKLGLSLDPALVAAPDDWRGAEALRGNLAQGMLLLLAAGERDQALLFALGLARDLDATGLGHLGALLEEMQEPYIAVLVGKAAAERGIAVPAAAFPIHPLARGTWPVGADLALAIARRESEFNAGVSSPVGAMGLMQLMPGTAREVAGQLGLPYVAARLTEWEYNATLGTRYLATLQEMFGTSPVLVAAGYNAGPGRPRQWIAARGDPRHASVDVVDWIEHIPFTETRTYVMRVSESIPVYRARLTGETGPIAFTALLKGEPPLIRPEVRPRLVDAASLRPMVERLSTTSLPDALAEGVAQAVDATLAQTLAVPATVAETFAPALATLRPRARPDPG